MCHTSLLAQTHLVFSITTGKLKGYKLLSEIGISSPIHFTDHSKQNWFYQTSEPFEVFRLVLLTCLTHMLLDYQFYLN